jgi:hypothetical protein
MGGVCETKKETIVENIPKVKIQDLPSVKEIKYYEYECPINIAELEKHQQLKQNQQQKPNNNNTPQQRHLIHLKFTLSNIKIHQCFSRDKTNKKSLFICELKLGKKIYPLFFNYGEYPMIYGVFEEKMDFLSLSELNKYYFIINIYEVISEFDDDKLRNFKENPGLLKTYKGYSKHCSYFQMDLLSFVFRANKHDFQLLGKRPISSMARITFQLDIEQLCSFTIIVQETEKNNNNGNGEFILNYKLFNSKINYDKKTNQYFMKTIPLSMNDLIYSDLYIQNNDKNSKEFKYDSLNELKDRLFKEYSSKIIKNLANFLFGYNDEITQNINYNILFPKSISKSDNKYSLSISNLPIVVQVRNKIFTEKGHKSNASMLYLINDDVHVLKYLKEKGVLYNEIHPKLLKRLDTLKSIHKKHHKLDVVLFEIQEFLNKSATKDKLMYHYQFYEELNNMLMLFMELGIKLIKMLQKTNDQSKIVTILEIVGLLLKREELNNEVIFYCIKKFDSLGTNIRMLYNDFFLYLFKLNKIVKDKIKPTMYEPLVDIYTSLYFRNAMIREALLNSLSLQVKDYESNIINEFLYDVKYDDSLSLYLMESTKDNLTNMVKTSEYFSNIIQEAYYLLIKNIWNYQYKQKIFVFPFDIMQFNDNQELVSTMAKYVKKNGILSLTTDFYDSVNYLSSSYSALKRINSNMITSTNAYDSASIYQLLEYLQYIIELYYKDTQNILIMDYSLVEKAISIIVNIENSLNLPKVFWLYYCNGHMIPASNIKWLIKNVINVNFVNFTFNWSWKIRSLFIKLVLYTIYDRLKYINGKYLDLGMLKDLMNNNDIDIDSPYKEQGIKDFNNIYEEYNQWKSVSKKNGYTDYPIIFLPLAKNDNID